MDSDKGLAWRPLEGVCTVNVGPFLFSLLEIPLMLRQVAEKVHCDNNCFGHGSVSLVQILKSRWSDWWSAENSKLQSIAIAEF